MEKKYNQLITTGVFPFSYWMKKIRLYKKVNRRKLADALGKGTQQIQRYETPNRNNSSKSHHNLPSLKTFKQICLILQVDPSTLLGLKWVKTNQLVEIGVIYEWKLEGDMVRWTCPVCSRENITYNDFRKHPKLLKKQLFECEYDGCGSLFNKLYEIIK